MFIIKNRLFFFVLIVLMLFSCTTIPEKQEEKSKDNFSPVIDYLQSEIRRVMRKQKVPGVVCVLVSGQQVIWQGAFGVSNIEKNTPMTMDTPLKVGSLSKIFTAIEVMRLVEEGYVGLDDPIAMHLPEFSINSRFKIAEPITIRNLLAHRSGLPRNGNVTQWFWDSGLDVLKEITHSVRDTYTAFPPANRFKYSNLGYNILGHLIEVKRGAPFAFYMKDHLLDPIGMKDSVFLSEYVDDRDKMSIGYYWYKGKNRAYDQYDLIRLASGNLHSTAKDLTEFLKFLFREGSADGRQILESKTLESMVTDRYSRPRDPMKIGVSWFLDSSYLSELVAFHSGDNNGTKSFIAQLPQRKIGIILVGNSVSFEQPATLIGFDALAELLKVQRDEMSSRQETTQPHMLEPHIAEDYTGKYIFNGDIVEITYKKNRLRARILGLNVNLEPIKEDQFRMKHWLLDLGLLDYETVEVSFHQGNGDEEDIMILTLEGTVNFICPRYQEISEIPSQWYELVGEYEVYARFESAYWDGSSFGKEEIRIENNVLLMSGLQGALKPISETVILLVGGVFDGETVFYESETGNLLWQDKIFKPLGGSS